jgi:hypothetical protein
MWFGIARYTGQEEAWDHVLYLRAGLPFLALVVLTLGYANPVRPWRWAVTAGATQVVAAFVSNPALGSLAPIGLVLFALITVGLVLAAYLGSAWARRARPGEVH